MVVGVRHRRRARATLSASSVAGLEQAQDGLYFFKRQAIGVGIGLVVLVATSLIPYRVYRRLAWPIFLVTAALLVAVLIVGTTVYGATRWLPLGPLSFQPSELAKFSVVVLLSALLVKKQSLLLDFGHFVVPVAAIVGTVGSAGCSSPTWAHRSSWGRPPWPSWPRRRRHCAMSPSSGCRRLRRRRRWPWLSLPPGAPHLLPRPVRRPAGRRLPAHPELSGPGDRGTFGVGLGASRARWLFLPNAHSDFIFAIIGEETGFLGGLVALLLRPAHRARSGGVLAGIGPLRTTARRRVDLHGWRHRHWSTSGE